ncbi:MAG: hypothetical protein IRY85_00800 [Micromonosporaceae bacterium]|nr:hypothetical protein [Micromonosporaceae bacterium]
MRLTVGPLPAAVYWRRRLLVLGALVLIVVGIVYACTRGSDADEQLSPDPASQTSESPSPTATTTPTTSPSPTLSPTPTAFTLPVSDPTGPCTDDEIELTASVSQTTLVVGQGATFTLTIKNISNRSCVRDIGSIPQELQLRRADGTVAWSSDDCRDEQVYGPDYHFNETLPPDFVKKFDIYWNGYRSRTGNDTTSCEPSDQAKPDADTYTLVARLDTKFSQPVQVVIRTSPA